MDALALSEGGRALLRRGEVVLSVSRVTLERVTRDQRWDPLCALAGDEDGNAHAAMVHTSPPRARWVHALAAAVVVALLARRRR